MRVVVDVGCVPDGKHPTASRGLPATRGKPLDERFGLHTGVVEVAEVGDVVIPTMREPVYHSGVAAEHRRTDCLGVFLNGAPEATPRNGIDLKPNIVSSQENFTQSPKSKSNSPHQQSTPTIGSDQFPRQNPLIRDVCIE